MQIKIEYRLDDDAPTETFTTNLYLCVIWERELKRKLTDGRGLGFEDWAFWTFAYLRLAGRVPADAKFMDWLEKNQQLHAAPIVDETDTNPTDGAPSDDN